ncbi:unnamed protein product [Rotaria sordida]|uniref:Uncharacterized protein n=1 Tax=Rotaria sordida TaxID=392033 RepID=A0A815S6U5_9BILA|nr:unnamed protein product [Rotaria sordida]CAF3851304.1 unnamed protein product [Rotaria sordida]
MLHFIRHRALLMCTLSELKIEEDYWKHVADVAMPTVRWLSQTSKDITKRNFINWDYPRTEHNIRHRQRLIDNKLQQAEANLKAHLQQSPPSEIHSVQKLWWMTAKSYKRAITLKKNSLLLTKQTSNQGMIHENSATEHINTFGFNCNTTNHPDQSVSTTLLQPFLSPMRNIIEARLLNIKQRAEQIMLFINTSTH